MRHIGRVFICKGYLAGNRDAVTFTSRAGRRGRMRRGGGRLRFHRRLEGARPRLDQPAVSDGTAVGVFDPGPTVGGVENTGWIDILTGITAFKRANGEYLVFVEEDYKAKVLLYRWRP